MIIQIPFANREAEDKLMLLENKDGTYTIKIGYHLLVNQDQILDPYSSNYMEKRRAWKKLCNIKTLTRIIFLTWCILNSTLPIRSKLRRRGVNCPIFCPMCMEKEETQDHILMH